MHIPEPFIVAELSGNHLGKLDNALALIRAAAKAGANAVKLQTYTPDNMTLATLPPMETGTWAGRGLHELYQEATTPREWHRRLFDYARDQGLICFSSPFDEDAVDFLETLHCPIYKIASPEITNLPLIRRAALTRKPLIISTGMAAWHEIREAVSCARTAGATDITLLKCVSAYPAQPESFNLATMADMRETLGCKVGLSDHSRGIAVAVAAVALGAIVVEKHLTLSRDSDGPDAGFSLTPGEFQAMARNCRAAHAALGYVVYGPTPAERDSLQYRRSIWVVKDVKAGEKLTMQNLCLLRPSAGLEPRHLPDILGRRAACDLPTGTPLQWGDVGNGNAQ